MLEGLVPPQKIAPCRIKQVLETLDAKDQAILEQSVANPDWPVSTLSRELQKRGITLGDKAIAAHRKGHCQCSKI
jgi:hypothetical protein